MVIHPMELVLDLVVAAILGGAVGIQRQASMKAAGFRTHLLVALASCAFAEVGRMTGDDRITANVLTGIGFLGAGAIFRSGLTAHGLTTAASIWSVAAVGVAIGYGHPASLAIGIAVTVITVVVLSVSDTVFLRVFVRKATLNLTFAGNVTSVECTGVLARHNVHYLPGGDITVDNSDQGPVVTMSYHIGMPRGVHASELINEISSIPGVRRVSMDAPMGDSL